jgi:hypothetical protein
VAAFPLRRDGAAVRDTADMQRQQVAATQRAVDGETLLCFTLENRKNLSKKTVKRGKLTHHTDSRVASPRQEANHDLVGPRGSNRLVLLGERWADCRS